MPGPAKDAPYTVRKLEPVITTLDSTRIDISREETDTPVVHVDGELDKVKAARELTKCENKQRHIREVSESQKEEAYPDPETETKAQWS